MASTSLQGRGMTASSFACQLAIAFGLGAVSAVATLRLSLMKAKLPGIYQLQSYFRLVRSCLTRTSPRNDTFKDKTDPTDPIWQGCGLSRPEIERYGRQVVLPKLGPAGQKAILDGSILVVGAGGLGCPVALYLCAAGVGRLGIVDGDTVALSNLHRQIGHSWRSVGMSKADSLVDACVSINDATMVRPYNMRLSTVEEAAQLMADYDVVVDCTDAPPSRYLLNDAALMASKPLVAASAVGLSGQLAVYNFEGGPCLRCAFPVFPGSADAAEPVASCEENGVLGPIVGTVGSLAALEALKVLAQGSGIHATCLRGRLLLYDALDAAQPCRSVRIRKQTGCVGCDRGEGDRPSLPPEGCPVRPSGHAVELSAADLQSRLRAGQPTLLLDVRQPPHFAVARLRQAENLPLPEMSRLTPDALVQRAESLRMKRAEAVGTEVEETKIVCVCRRGVDSLTATLLLRKAGIKAWNLAGGLQELSRAAPCILSLPALT